MRTVEVKRECRVLAGANTLSQPMVPITYATLVGTGTGYSTGVQQAVIPATFRDQVRKARLKYGTNWMKDPPSPP